MKTVSSDCGHGPSRSPGLRACMLFANFFLIIMALYNLKPASRSLFIESLGTDRLPYVWIGTAAVMGTIIMYYHRLVARYSRLAIVLASCLTVSLLLIMFSQLLARPSITASVAFYIFVDILSVILVEQFWSLTNSIHTTTEGKSWYGYIGSGGLAGGIAGSGLAALLLKKAGLHTTDLLLVAATIIGLTALLTLLMARLGLYREVSAAQSHNRIGEGWRAFTRNRYLGLIAVILLLAQLASPLIEFQFLKTVEAVYLEREVRTAFLSSFFSLLGVVSILINLLITPFVHRFLGVIAGLLVQPVLMGFCSWGFLLQPTLVFGAAVKISDRALSYSINRASKELLYVPVDPLLIYQAKAWIDMFGYRLFKVFGSLLILLCTQWLPVRLSAPGLSWFTCSICAAWIWVIFLIRRDYRGALQEAM